MVPQPVFHGTVEMKKLMMNHLISKNAMMATMTTVMVAAQLVKLKANTSAISSTMTTNCQLASACAVMAFGNSTLAKNATMETMTTMMVAIKNAILNGATLAHNQTVDRILELNAVLFAAIGKLVEKKSAMMEILTILMVALLHARLKDLVGTVPKVNPARLTIAETATEPEKKFVMTEILTTETAATTIARSSRAIDAQAVPPLIRTPAQQPQATPSQHPLCQLARTSPATSTTPATNTSTTPSTRQT